MNSETREKIYDFIIVFKRQHDGISPTLREIAANTGISSTAVVSYHIDKLIIEGRLEKYGGWMTTRNLMVPGALWIHSDDIPSAIPSCVFCMSNEREQLYCFIEQEGNTKIGYRCSNCGAEYHTELIAPDSAWDDMYFEEEDTKD
jgi:hypothetical protein